MSDSQGEPELKRDSESADVVEIAGKWLALLAVLLPAAGLLVRYVAYSLALPNESALRLAWSTTLIELSVIGFVSILLPAALVILAEIAYRLLRGPLNRIRERSARTKRAVIILLLVVTGIAFAFVPGWPISIVL